MRRLSVAPFDAAMAVVFPDEPFDVFPYAKYAEPSVKSLPIKLPDTQFIPVTNNRYGHEEPVILYPFSTLGSSNSERSRSDIHTLFPKVEQVGLLMTGKDIPLVEFTREESWTKVIAKKNFDFVFSPNFSFFNNQPSCSTVLNRLLIYKSIKELLSEGIPVIPTIDYLWLSDLDRYAKWLNRSGFDYVYFNAQRLKDENAYDRLEKDLITINERVEAEVIIVGMNNVEKIKRFNRIRKYRYAHSQLHMLSANRIKLLPNGKEEKSGKLEFLFYDDLLQFNLESYRTLLQRAR